MKIDWTSYTYQAPYKVLWGWNDEKTVFSSYGTLVEKGRCDMRRQSVNVCGTVILRPHTPMHCNVRTIEKEQGTVTEVTCLPGSIRRMSFTVPQFLHLQNRDNNRTFLKGLERGINELIHVRCSERCLVYKRTIEMFATIIINSS